MFCGLEEESTKIKKKKRKKKNLIAAKSGVGLKGYVKTYKPYEIFFAVLKLFLTETAFYTKLAGRFSGFKTKVTRPLASKFGTNI